MASLADTIRSIATKQPLVEAAQPFMQASQPNPGDSTAVNTGPAGGTPQEPDEAGTAVVQAELILIADRAQKIATLAGQGGAVDPMLQTQITGIASDISQLYADLVMSAMPDPNDPNAQQGTPAPGGSQVNTNPKVAEDQLPNLESTKPLTEISNTLAKNYIRKSFNQLGSEDEVDPKVAKRRAAGMALATDKAGGVDALYGNKSELGKKYGKAAAPVRVRTSEDVDLFAQGYYEPPVDVTEASAEVAAERNKNRYASLDHKTAKDSDFLRNDHNGQKATPLVHKDGHKIGMNVRKGALYTHITNKGKETNFKSQQDMDSFLHKFHRSKMSEEEISELAEMFGIKGNPAVIAAADALKKKPADKSGTRMPGVRMPSDKIKEAVAPKPDGDNDADDENEHIIMQLHKSVTLGGKKIVKFASGQKVKVDPKMAHRAIQKFSAMKPMEKVKAQEYLRQSHNNLQSFVNEDIDFNDDVEELEERVIKAEPHFIDQLSGSAETSSGKEIEFENGQKVTIPPNIAKKIVDKFQGASAYDKQKLQKYVRSSYANLIRAARG